MDNPIRVLQVTSGFRKGVSGGIAAVLSNYGTSKYLKEGITIDYLALGYQPFEPYRDALEDCGSNLYSLNIHSNGNKRLVDIFKKLKRFLVEHTYDIVHINSGALTQVYVSCLAAKKAKVRVVIAHSHNAIEAKGKRAIIYPFLRKAISSVADYLYACSEVAAKSMFSKKTIETQSWIYLPNAIDTEKFSFNSENRVYYRKVFGIDGKYVIGHVGRFNEQKNHEFLIKVFSNVIKKNSDYRLLLLGIGDLQGRIMELVKRFGIEDKVIFAGQRKDVYRILSAMDLFVLPSKWEGLPVTIIEAQANGLKCIISDRITPEVKLSDNVAYVSIDNGTDEWVSLVKQYTKDEASRDNIVKGSIFDINVSGKMLFDNYKSYLNK